MFSVEEYRVEVLAILNHSTRLNMCNLRMELFMVAAASDNAENCLMPFPSCFFNAVTKQKRIKDLQRKLRKIPKLSKINEYTNMDGDLWELLYWVFTNPLNIQPVPKSETKETMKTWSQQTGLDFRAIIDCKRIFLYTVVNPVPKKEFTAGKAKYGTIFGFHGSRVENFHSIVHRGLLAALNRISAFGRGSYFSSDLAVSLGYACKQRGWEKSEIGATVQCVAICEIVNDPRVKKPISTYYVVANDELVQLSHLIVFA